MGDQEHVFTPTEEEVTNEMMEIEYDCAEDKYFRKGRVVVKEGFLTGVFSSENVARIEGNCDKGEVSWKFKMPEGVIVKKVKLVVGSTCYEGGVVTWQLCGSNSCLLPAAGEEMITDQLSGSKEIQLTARMVGGKGDTAWQHTQLFRCPRDDAGDLPQMKICIWMENSGNS